MKNNQIAIIGLGYVGLPLAIEFSNKFKVVGFDIDSKRIEELNSFEDRTNEVDSLMLRRTIDEQKIKFTSDVSALISCNIFIITVPTPIDKYKRPDLIPLLSATKTVAKILKKNDLVIYESTVYPGCTEEECVPVLEQISNLKFNKDFFCGYSPERINPGDKVNTLRSIKKVTSGSTPAVAKRVNELYQSIIEAGTHLAPSIKVAEASKAIENAQRDLNISFVNELALIFDLLGIDTKDVIDAASTKWNFLKFMPGLVGGHCISVDPYYLAHKAELMGYIPQVILSGRRVNDMMGVYIASKVIKLMIYKEIPIKNSSVLILGITFKENCPDTRNSKVVDIINEFVKFGINVDVFDTHADPHDVSVEFGIELIPKISSTYDAIVLAVDHNEFKTLPYKDIMKNPGILYDIKSTLDKTIVDGRL